MLKTIARQFRQPSGFLGKIISIVMKKGNMSNYVHMLEYLNIKNGDKLFEIGYGHGLGIYTMVSKYDCSISGIDFSELMYKEACKRNSKFIDAGRVDLKFGNFLDYDLIEAAFDKIICINVVYFWEDLIKPFSKIKSGLKPGGTFCFFMAHIDDLLKFKFTKTAVFNKYTIEQVIEKLKIAGFENVDYKFDKGYYIVCMK